MRLVKRRDRILSFKKANSRVKSEPRQPVKSAQATATSSRDFTSRRNASEPAPVAVASTMRPM
eukprot:scaffold676970_cov51-Prasinocladus_malaysianus.AAC.1